MERKQLEIISLNASMAEQDEQSLVERQEAMGLAAQEVSEVYAAGLPDDALLPDQLEEAAIYTTSLLYRMGSPAFNPDDINRAIQIDSEYISHSEPEAARWLNASDKRRELVAELLKQASLLAISDHQPAYAPHVNGRGPELLDSPSSLYNKYGLLVRQAPTV